MLIALERRRPARQQSRQWIAHQDRKIARAVDALARELEDRPWCNGEAYSLADIATGCALGYLDLRHADAHVARSPSESRAPRGKARRRGRRSQTRPRRRDIAQLNLALQRSAPTRKIGAARHDHGVVVDTRPLQIFRPVRVD